VVADSGRNENNIYRRETLLYNEELEFDAISHF
jgi:hypothetical protein